MKQKKKKKIFLKEFLKERKEVGSVTPSSKFLCRKICKPIDFETADIIVELGPGTGVVTREIVSRMKPGTQLLIFETNEEFFDTLKSEFAKNEDIYLFNTSAENVLIELKKLGHKENSVSTVVSSLPLAVIPNEIVNAIVSNSMKSMKSDGQYIQFQYSLNSLKLLKKKFREVKVNFTPMNVPPAFVYTCKM